MHVVTSSHVKLKSFDFVHGQLFQVSKFTGFHLPSSVPRDQHDGRTPGCRWPSNEVSLLHEIKPLLLHSLLSEPLKNSFQSLSSIGSRQQSKPILRSSRKLQDGFHPNCHLDYRFLISTSIQRLKLVCRTRSWRNRSTSFPHPYFVSSVTDVLKRAEALSLESKGSWALRLSFPSWDRHDPVWITRRDAPSDSRSNPAVSVSRILLSASSTRAKITHCLHQHISHIFQLVFTFEVKQNCYCVRAPVWTPVSVIVLTLVIYYFYEVLFYPFVAPHRSSTQLP